MIQVYDEHHVFDPVVLDQYDTKISVTELDTLAQAKELIDQGFSEPCCLNFASHRRPGGGYKAVQDLPMPIKTQEEDLFRRSNLPDMMDNQVVRQHYPLMGSKGLYCNGVQVDRDEKLVRHDPYFISLITLAAVVNPQPEDRNTTRAKVKRILEIAAAQKQEVLVLGAWGCGAFHNDPNEIAGLFKNYLEVDFKGVFSHVVFAIPTGRRPGRKPEPGRGNPNHDIFESVLSS
jgi:uncharacterized protein (TIGR02452 family)